MADGFYVWLCRPSAILWHYIAICWFGGCKARIRVHDGPLTPFSPFDRSEWLAPRPLALPKSLDREPPSSAPPLFPPVPSPTTRANSARSHSSPTHPPTRPLKMDFTQPNTLGLTEVLSTHSTTRPFDVDTRSTEKSVPHVTRSTESHGETWSVCRILWMKSRPWQRK
jgi:hypothetical protein